MEDNQQNPQDESIVGRDADGQLDNSLTGPQDFEAERSETSQDREDSAERQGDLEVEFESGNPDDGGEA